jgi:glucose-6-phosphate isomerase
MAMMIGSTGQAPSRMARAAWKALEPNCQTIRHLHLRQRFADDPRRGERFALEAAGLYLDDSKHRMTDETIRRLMRSPRSAACGRASTRCSAATRST